MITAQSKVPVSQRHRCVSNTKKEHMPNPAPNPFQNMALAYQSFLLLVDPENDASVADSLISLIERLRELVDFRDRVGMS